MLAVSVLMVCALIAAASAVLHSHRQSGDQISAANATFERLERQLGLRVEFIPRGRARDNRDPYGIVIRLVSEAEHEILVLDHRPARDVDRFGAEMLLDSASRERYYDLLTARTTGRGKDDAYLRYRRVVQLDNGATASWDWNENGDVIFAAHCDALNQQRFDDAQFPSAIKTSSVFFPNASLMIVDGHTILLELAVAGPKGGPRVQGDLVFYDPDGQLAGPLRQLFENIDLQSTLVTEVR